MKERTAFSTLISPTKSPMFSVIQNLISFSILQLLSFNCAQQKYEKEREKRERGGEEREREKEKREKKEEKRKRGKRGEKRKKRRKGEKEEKEEKELFLHCDNSPVHPPTTSVKRTEKP